jgi:hypothetical protein
VRAAINPAAAGGAFGILQVQSRREEICLTHSTFIMTPDCDGLEQRFAVHAIRVAGSTRIQE